MGPPRSTPKAPKVSSLKWLFFMLVGSFVVFLVMAVLGAVAFFIQIDRSLPSTQSLKNYHPALVSTIYAANGSLMGEFYTERRYLVPLSEMPPHLIKAFLAAEDVRFYEHKGVDPVGIVRAMFKNVQAGEIVQGGSTITQQVVKSLLLTSERTWIRKVKEAILAYRIDNFLSKDEVLYLYLNQVYLGGGAYGVEAAAQVYFGKHVNELTLPESALIAGMPKAPSNYSPLRNFAAARERERYVLDRMAEVGFVTPEDARSAFDQPLTLAKPHSWGMRDLNSFSEEVRRQVEARYGRDGLYREGLRIYTTLDLDAQQMAENSLEKGLRELDKRHGYRGAHHHVSKDGWTDYLKGLEGRNKEQPQEHPLEALVTGYDAKAKTFSIDTGIFKGQLSLSRSKWAQGYFQRGPKSFQPGDVIWVSTREEKGARIVELDQEPEVQGALLSMEPDTGRVICMVGGRDFAQSQFNRATQAIRQPGSSFKPIVYAAALDKGYTPVSILVDSPLARWDSSLRGAWHPENYDHQYWGSIPLRKALVHSRNVPTVKLLDDIGVSYVIDYAHRLGIQSSLTPTLSLALGASGLTLWEMMTAYSAFANHGERSNPYMIEMVTDRSGNVLERRQIQHESVISPQTAYLMTSLLEGVVEEGTGKRAKDLGRPAAGKTGTSNDLKDAWFLGYTPSVLTGAWVGNDDNRKPLGGGETGGHAACPIWLYFMQDYLKNKPVEAFPVPDGIVFAKINRNSGALSAAYDPNAVYCAFDENQMPTLRASRKIETESTEPSEATTSSPDSFFKSDLF